jgi:hypothetical protein
MGENSETQGLFDRVKAEILSGALREDRLTGELKDLAEAQGVEMDPTLAAALQAHAVGVLSALRTAEASWREPTVNDRLDQAFAALDAAGIVALQNAGYTLSDGWSDVNAIATERAARGSRPQGAVFYHGQDAARGVAGDGLMLAFGAYEEDKAKKDAAAQAVAREVVATLDRHGISASWNGSVDSRISIAPFTWQKRRYSKAPALRAAAAPATATRAPPASDDDDAEERDSAAQAQQIVAGLLESELLELSTPRSRAALESALASELVEPPESLDALAETLLDWFVEQPAVAEIYADGAALAALLRRVDPPFALGD